MWLDLFCGAVVFLYALAGYRRGFALSLVLLLATSAAIALSRLLAPHIGATAISHWNYWYGAETSVAFCGLLFITIPLLRSATRLFFGATIGTMPPSGLVSATLGSLLGVITASMITWALLSGFSAIRGKISQNEDLNISFDNSFTINICEKFHILGKDAVPHHDLLRRVVQTLKGPKATISDQLGDLLSWPESAPLRDHELVQSIHNKDWGLVAAHPGTWQLLTQHTLVNRILLLEDRPDFPL